MATNSEMKDIELSSQFASKLPNRQMQLHGIERKLMNLVQYISWIKVRNISLHLVETQTSTDFYENLFF